MILYAFIFIPVVAAILLYLIPGKGIMRFVFGLQAFLLGLSIYNFVMIGRDGPVEAVIGGFEKIAGITLRCDVLAGAMLMLTSFIFLMCFVFGLMERYMNSRFIFFFTILQALIMAIFLSRDIFNIYVVTEVSTIIVAVLIMFKKDTRSMYDGMMYLITNVAAMTFFLFGAAMLYRIFGTLDMDLIGSGMHSVENTRAIILPFAFIMTGISLKCAFIPLFNWLPNAHATPAAPAIVSVVLSGLYVKCGIFMFIRFREMFEPALVADNIFLIIGIATGIAGFTLGVMKNDIKMILAYSTISQIGLMLMGLASGSGDAYHGAILHILNHAVFKSLLFFFAGIVISKYGTRDIRKIRGVFRRMPYVSMMAFAAMLGITGAPFFNGSISKYFIEHGFAGSVLEYAVLLINLGTMVYFIKFSQIFFKGKDEEKIETDIWKKISMTVMGTLCLIMGMTGTIVIREVFHYDASLDFSGYLKNSLIFFATLAGGYLIYTKLLAKTDYVSNGYSLEPGVNGIGVSMAGFFVFMAVAAHFIV